jgi:hypothetical protein
MNRPAELALSNEVDGDDAVDALFLVIFTKRNNLKEKIFIFTDTQTVSSGMNIIFQFFSFFFSVIFEIKKNQRTKLFGRKKNE